jgi:DNA-binding protein YbaB
MSETPRSGAGDRDPDHAEAFDLAGLMSDFEKQMAALRERAQPLRAMIDAASIRVESDGHEVAVTATFAGALVDVEILPAADAIAPDDLAALIVATSERAATEARERNRDLVAGFMDYNARPGEREFRRIEQAAAERVRRQRGES